MHGHKNIKIKIHVFMNMPVIFSTTTNFFAFSSNVVHRATFGVPSRLKNQFQTTNSSSKCYFCFRIFFLYGVKRMRSGVGKRAKVILGVQSDGIT